jgi:hypothetical protein
LGPWQTFLVYNGERNVAKSHDYIYLLFFLLLFND